MSVKWKSFWTVWSSVKWNFSWTVWLPLLYGLGQNCSRVGIKCSQALYQFYLVSCLLHLLITHKCSKLDVLNLFMVFLSTPPFSFSSVNMWLDRGRLCFYLPHHKGYIKTMGQQFITTQPRPTQYTMWFENTYLGTRQDPLLIFTEADVLHPANMTLKITHLMT